MLETQLTLTGEDAFHLRQKAEALRLERKGSVLLRRGIIEFSNCCVNNCTYCGIRAANSSPLRYRIPLDRIKASAEKIREEGIETVVLQSGEDPWYTPERLIEIIRALKPAIITLSVGVRPFDELKAFKEAGANRFLLRFETCLPDRFAAIHPDEPFEKRIECLHNIRRAGLEVGTGFMIGLPGDTVSDVARNLEFTASLKPDMIGCGPFIPDPSTPLAGGRPAFSGLDVYYNAVALLRLMNPDANIPATTAFDSLEPDGRKKVLACGCNVWMPKFTPCDYAAEYSLYPKAIPDRETTI